MFRSKTPKASTLVWAHGISLWRYLGAKDLQEERRNTCLWMQWTAKEQKRKQAPPQRKHKESMVQAPQRFGKCRKKLAFPDGDSYKKTNDKPNIQEIAFMKKIKWFLVALFLLVGAAFLTGCEDDENVHKITLHNKSSYTVQQRISGYGWVTIEAGKKRAFDDYSFSLYEYKPKDRVYRVKENSHTFVYKNR